MKKLVWFCITAMTVSSFIACGVKDRTKVNSRLATPKDKTTTDGGKETNNQDQAKSSSEEVDSTENNETDNSLAELCKGGEPGMISVGGKALVGQNADHANILNSQVIANRSFGKKVGQTVVAMTSVTPDVQSDLLTATSESLAKVHSSDSIINLGCEKNLIPAEYSEKKLLSITSSKAATSLAVSAIFICGENTVSSALLTLVTDLLVLNSAKLIYTNVEVGGISVVANTLRLEGQNTLEARTNDAKQFASAGLTLSLHVKEAMSPGAGSLQLLTVGGNCIEKDKSETNTNIESRELTLAEKEKRAISDDIQETENESGIE